MLLILSLQFASSSEFSLLETTKTRITKTTINNCNKSPNELGKNQNMMTINNIDLIKT